MLATSASSGYALDVSDLRCTFMVEKTLNDTPNYSQIAIYNLAGSTIGAIESGSKVVLEAGYQGGNYGLIFSGEVVQPLITREGGTDTILTLICQDGDVFLTSQFTAQTLSKGSTHLDVVSACLNGEADIAAGNISQELGATRLPRGKVLFGKSADYVRRIAATNAAQMYVDDGMLSIVAARDYDESTAVELSPSTGLIGTPSQTDDGVSGQCLLNPSIKLNTMRYISSSLVAAKQISAGETSAPAINADGVYRIVKLTYEGDTRGDAWYCNFEAIAQSGARPSGLVGAASNPWR